MTLYAVEVALRDGTWSDKRDRWWGRFTCGHAIYTGIVAVPQVWLDEDDAAPAKMNAILGTQCHARVVAFDERL